MLSRMDFGSRLHTVHFHNGYISMLGKLHRLVYHSSRLGETSIGA